MEDSDQQEILLAVPPVWENLSANRRQAMNRNVNMGNPDNEESHNGNQKLSGTFLMQQNIMQAKWRFL